MAALDGKIKVDGVFLRYGDVILNRMEVEHADIGVGEIVMRSGRTNRLPSELVQCWFADVADYKTPFEQGLLTGVRAADLGNGHHA